ncbi:EF-P beta-lysylation protein EpmB [bacterium]|nr:EF-P beta-lysylation protein EpmB [bacterium]
MQHTEFAVLRQPNWRDSFAWAIRNSDELIDRLQLPESLKGPARLAAETFPLVVPESFLARMKTGDPSDPLLRQVLPISHELESPATYQIDPVGDQAARVLPGLLQKYEGRALLITTGACAVHCRYCFRRHYPYQDDPKGLEELEPAFAQIEADRTIREVILSGGDPLTRTDSWLSRLGERINRIPHVEVVRIHTRLPIVLPDRVDPSLIAWMTESRWKPVVVLHANHPNELVDDCADAIGRLREAGMVLLNQAVLLRGVNDDVETLEQLSRRLIQLGVLPYYLHQLDRVRGAAHFEVSLDQGRRLIEELRKRLPGYLVPRFVQEIEGEPSKTPLA